MAIAGSEKGFADERVTLPLCGMYYAKNKAGNAYTLYIDHFTTAAKVKRSYKKVAIKTRDATSLFMRLSEAFGVKHAPKVTQVHAAKALAMAMARKGALKCRRAGKDHDWVDIAPVDIAGHKLPWDYAKIDGLQLIDLWVFSKEEQAPAADTHQVQQDTMPHDEGNTCFSILGKKFKDVMKDLEAGVTVAQVEQALSVGIADDDVDIHCYMAVDDLLRHAIDERQDIVRLEPRGEHVQA